MPFCPECGTKIEQGKFCPECGTKLPDGAGAAAAPAPTPAPAVAAKPVAKAPAASGKGPVNSPLVKHEDWIYYDTACKQISQGNGIASLKAALPDADCGFAFFRLYAENVGNVGKGITTEANIILQWKGPDAKTMAKVKNGQGLQNALSSLNPNKGFIEVLGKKNLTTDQIYDCWRPGSGSKVIQD
eukprot:CAMPEP_0175141616 /NCGR_PEP_ID=MMETSP0087-20121206/12247_1 /TAXON_ID=136419 /ORGANISM="Unknown Unknown, Strain D1" /LENGTH=185 /DNA_ID=CAMNT_0016425137 /DNA_START=49 /DNA_END=606 /DNA_ORIENTATION=-